MPSPEEIHARLPLSPTAAGLVMHGREVLRNILDRKDHRLFVVVGPCSIHDPVAGLDYARRLKALADEVGDTLYLVMRVYFEKPRTTTGWKGYINDPDMDDSFRVDQGMQKAREFLLDVAEIGLPAGTEALDPISPQYLGDLIAWTAIGARTTESQTHREMSSGLSTPVGFKNGTNGDLAIAGQRHPFRLAAAQLPRHQRPGPRRHRAHRGNRYGHLVLRGGDGRPNYDTVSVQMAEQALPRPSCRQHRGRLLARQQLQEARAATAGDGRCGQPGAPRQPVAGRHDDRVEPRRRQPADPRRPVAAEVRLLGHRRLCRLGRPPKK
jgi:3-deoxy-7-phosphoheptulonate synthase